DGIRDFHVTGVQTCALPILPRGCRPATGATGAAVALTDPLGAAVSDSVTSLFTECGNSAAAGATGRATASALRTSRMRARPQDRSEEHTSELQSRENLVCRL